MDQQVAAGAEAVIERRGDLVTKRRVPKNYRLPDLDTRIRSTRTRIEAKLISEARRCGVPTPIIHDVDIMDYTITMEFIAGQPLKNVLNLRISERVGELVGRLHGCGIIHGDLTTAWLLRKECGGAGRRCACPIPDVCEYAWRSGAGGCVFGRIPPDVC